MVIRYMILILCGAKALAEDTSPQHDTQHKVLEKIFHQALHHLHEKPSLSTLENTSAKALSIMEKPQAEHFWQKLMQKFL